MRIHDAKNSLASVIYAPYALPFLHVGVHLAQIFLCIRIKRTELQFDEPFGALIALQAIAAGTREDDILNVP